MQRTGQQGTAPGALLHGQGDTLQRRGGILHGCSHPAQLRVKLDTLGFGDKEVTKLSARSSPHSSSQAELLVATPARLLVQDVSVGRCGHRAVAQSPGVEGRGGSKGDEGFLFWVSTGKLPCAIHHWPAAPSRRRKCLFSNQGLERCSVSIFWCSWVTNPGLCGAAIGCFGWCHFLAVTKA